MNIISQVIKHRRSTVKYPLKHGVTKAAIQYNTYRPYVYRWLRRYNGSLESLVINPAGQNTIPKHIQLRN